MKLTEITYSMGRTIQVKQYEPMNLHYSIKAEVTDKDDLRKCWAKLRAEVDKQMGADLMIWDKPQTAVNHLYKMGEKEVKDRIEDVPF